MFVTMKKRFLMKTKDKTKSIKNYNDKFCKKYNKMVEN